MNKTRSLFLLGLCLCVFFGCSRFIFRADQPNSNQSLPTGKPYTVRGKTYYPYTTATGFTEAGIASWYGPGFHVKKTANGETSNQNAMTVAHKLLPFSTSLRVTNLDNGRSAVVRVNDRGPFVDNRIIDLSRRAAEQLDMVRSGTARVRLEALNGQTVGTRSETPQKAIFYIQLGAFAQEENARDRMRVLQNSGQSGRLLHKSGLHHVHAGPFPTRESAEAAARRLASAWPGLFIVAQ